jgi:hypothetical protein
MALSGSDKAYLYARAGLARSGATRSGYVPPLLGVEWIRRDSAGAITSIVDITGLVLLGSLHVTQALNDEPDTCSFEIGPQDPPADLPRVGQEIRVTWAPGTAPLFHGYVLVTQEDWRLGNLQAPWLSVQCQDAMWRFDARIVVYKFPQQSVSQSIADLVRLFCNLDPESAGALDFSTAFVQPGMPIIPAVEVMNERPSTVLRTLTAAVGGGFYIEGLNVHAWAGSVSEPGQADPVPLTVGLKSLKSFRLTTDATQVRRRVLVEGRRTSTLIGWPESIASHTNMMGIPLSDASMFDLTLPSNSPQLTRTGAAWLRMTYPNTAGSAAPNALQTKVAVAYAPTQQELHVEAVPVAPAPSGWIRVGGQIGRYNAITGNPLTGVFQLHIIEESFLPYGHFTSPMKIGETVEWVDGVMGMLQAKYGPWDSNLTWAETAFAQVVGAPVVTLGTAQMALDGWPPLEGFVQDGRYSYAGAQARAAADLDAFKDPLKSVEWVTEDVTALPGRSQVIALESATIDPPIKLTVTILSVDLSFPLRTLAPRRACAGGILKPSTFLDLVVTTQN